MKSANKLKNLSEKINRAKEEYIVEAKNLFNTFAKEIFEKHPKLESFSWYQYTPYFNDGDTCEFGVHNDYLYMVFDGEELEEVCDYSFRAGKKYNKIVGLKEAYEDINDVLSSISSDAYESMFGDHVRVTVSRENGLEISDYDHE